MSQESARFFLERARNDKKFARHLAAIDSSHALMENIRSWGYDFTLEDLKYAFVALSNLSEEELSSVSGGMADWGILWEALRWAGVSAQS